MAMGLGRLRGPWVREGRTLRGHVWRGRGRRGLPVADACPIDVVRLWTVARKLSFLASVPAAETREVDVPARTKVDQACITSAHLDRPFGPARRSLGWSSRKGYGGVLFGGRRL
jgi:hypothetical protein